MSSGGMAGRGHVVEIAAVLVVGPDQQRAAPPGAGHDRVDDRRGERFPLDDVLRVLLGLDGVVRLDQAQAGQRARGRVGEEVGDRDHVRAQVLEVQLRVELDRGQVGVVVPPADARRGHLVEDRPARRVVGERGQRVVHLADRGGGDQVAPVGVGLAEHRAEVAVGDREHRGQRIVERLVGLLPVAHGDRPAARLDEAVVTPAVELGVAGQPVLGRRAGELAGGGHAERVLDVAVGVRVGGERPAAWAEPEPVRAAAAQHAELVVVGVVLHHQHDDVLDLRDRVGARGQLRVGQRSRLAEPGVAPGAARRRPPRAGPRDGARRQAGLQQPAPARPAGPAVPVTAHDNLPSQPADRAESVRPA